MQLLLIRHARPVRVDHAPHGADPDLDELGRRQAEALAEWLDPEPIDALYTSPLLRARRTAEPLARRRRLDVVVDEGIIEWDDDSTSYVHVEELRAARDPRWLELAAGLDDHEGHLFRDRVVGAVESIVDRHPGATVALTCHGGVVAAYLSHVLGLRTPMFFEAGYASIARVMAARDGTRSVRSLNELAHLRDL